MTEKRPATPPSTPGEIHILRSQLDREYPYLFDLYRELHASPEISGREFRTAERLAAELEGIGFQTIRNVGGNGVVAVLRNGAGPVVAVRADLDALPIVEATGLPYASVSTSLDAEGRETGVMHACGHDMHMTVMVGAARILAARLDDWRGTLLLIGQPDEENGSGAEAMIRDGLFTRFPRPDAILALHVAPPMPAGMVGCSEGAAMAGCADLEIAIRGIGGHGSRPHEAKDPIVMAAETVLLLQTVVSRETDPGETAVLTVGSIHGGNRGNIIPEEVLLRVNYRYFKAEVETRIRAAMERIVRGVAVAAGVPEDRMPVITTRMTGPPVLNDPALTARLTSLFASLLGRERVIRVAPLSASDDFAHFGAVEPQIPLFYFFLGVADSLGIAECARKNLPYPGIHNPSFAPLPEPSIRTGVTAMAGAVIDLLTGR